jgi:3-phosphoshikimate 1-carboxyvinyltransferase
MIYSISHPTKNISGEIHLTASKSESNRALVIRALCGHPFEIKNLAAAADTDTMLRLLDSTEALKDVGPAGTTMRFLTAYYCTQEGVVTMTGSERMKQRPIGILVDALRQLGADIEYEGEEGFPPLRIAGKPLQGGKIKMDGSVSSQFITAVLLIAPTLPLGLEIEFTGEVASRPYLEMTLRMMRYFGANWNWNGAELHVASGGYTGKPFTVEADWSAASYWYEMAALSEKSDFFLYGLKKESLQGDCVIAELYGQFGIETEFIEGGIHIKKQNDPNPPSTHLVYNFEDCPDVAQTLACTCAGLGWTAGMDGLKSLRIKETDRTLALHVELQKLGVDSAVLGDDRFTIGQGKVPMNAEAVIDTYEDHRMAMAFAPLALTMNRIQVEDPTVVDKSYPHYWSDLKSVGFEITEIGLN